MTAGNGVSDVGQPKPNPYIDEWGRRYGYCNACGEEAPLDTECCEDGEVVPYDNDPDPEGYND